MAPMALLAGLIGIGFGTLNAANQYWLPSLVFFKYYGDCWLGHLSPATRKLPIPIRHAGWASFGLGTLVSAVLQWLVQVPAQLRHGYFTPAV